MRTAYLFLLVCLVLIGEAHGQSTFSTVLGNVLDPSGLPVAGASVTLTEIDDRAAVTAASDEQGRYEFLNVRPGQYRISVVKPGFTTGVAEHVRLGARTSLRADFRLVLAARTDFAGISAFVPMVQLDSGAIADSKTAEQIDRLPLNFRASTTSALPAVAIFPGVQEDDFGRISIGGAMPAQSEFSVDGISTLSVRGGGALGVLFRSSDPVSPEALSEFRISSINSKAEFGQVNDVTLISRSGSNTPHGSLLWYHQNAALDAKTYGAPTKQAKVFNTFGTTLGGPVVLPGVYRGVNRTFFFAHYEGSRKPGSILDQFSVPTAAMRAGDLNGVPGPVAVDPLTGAPFPGNVIPQDRISAVATALFSHYLPPPNYPGVSQNYRRLTRQDTRADSFNARVDQILSPRQHLFGRWSGNWADYPDDVGILPPSQVPAATQSLVVAHTFAIQTNVLNEARFGFTRFQENQQFPLQGKSVVATLGLQGLDLTNVGSSGGFPYIDFSDGTGFTYTFEPRDSSLRSRTHQFSDALSWAAGRHTFKFGAEFRRVAYASTLHNGDGADDFGGLEFDSGVFSGNAFADFLLGLPTVSYYAALGPNIAESANHFAFFAQDDWKVSRAFTVNIGLRWELHPPMHESSGNITNFQRSNGAVIVPDQSLPPAPSFLVGVNACPGLVSTIPCTPILRASQAGLPDTLRRTYYGNWDPRLGFAWQPFSSGKFAVRGGIGVYTQLLLGGAAYAMTGVHSSDVRTFVNQDENGQPLFHLPQVSPAGLGQLSPGGESFFDATDPNLKDPRTYQWNFTLEREMPGSNLLRVSYIGSHSTGLLERVNLNQVPASKIPFSPSRLPYPTWSNVVSVDNLGFASYEALQAEASHRYRTGFFYQASYVLAKNIGAVGEPPSNRSVFPPDFYSSLITDRYNPRYDRGNIGGSRRQRFLLTGVFPLPWGYGRRFGNHWNAVSDMLAGGWEISTVTMLETGPYLTPTLSPSLDRSNTGVGFRGGQARPDRIGDGNLDNPTRQRYWDASAFVPAPVGAGRFGNAGAGILRAPGTIAVAAGLAKSFVVTERFRLRLEATFTNLPNHPNFLPPIAVVTNPQFGRLTTVQSSENSGNRTGQLGARVDF